MHYQQRPDRARYRRPVAEVRAKEGEPRVQPRQRQDVDGHRGRSRLTASKTFLGLNSVRMVPLLPEIRLPYQCILAPVW